MEENKRLLKNTILISIGNFGAKIVSFLLLPLYTAYLSTSEYGTYDFLVAIGAFLLPIVTFSMHEALFRYSIDFKTQKEKLDELTTNSFLYVLYGNVLLLILILLLKIFFPKINYLAYLFFFVFANSLYSYASNMLRGLGNVKLFSLITTLKNIMQLLLNIFCILVLKVGIKGLLLSFIISELISFLIISINIKLYSRINPKYISIKNTFYLLKYSIPLIPNAIGTQIINLSDRLIISLFMGSSFNGIYSISYKFPSVIDTLYHFFYMAWSESASIVLNKSKEKAIEYYKKLYITLDNFVFGIILFIISFMPILFRLLIKENYLSGFEYVWILMIAMYFNCLAKFYSGIYTAFKLTKTMATSTIIAAICNLVLNLLFINKFGLYAAAYSTLIAEFILLLIRRKNIKNIIYIFESKYRIVMKVLAIICVLILYDYNNPYKIIISIILSSILFVILNKDILYKTFKIIERKVKKS